MKRPAVPTVPRIEVAFEGHVRLLPARFHDPAPLADPGHESDTLNALDALVSLAGRLGSTDAADSREPRSNEMELARWRRHCVEAAFAHPRPGAVASTTGIAVPGTRRTP